MTSLTIRELRQRWPAAEKALETENEIIVTRDGKPVAKLVRFTEPAKCRPRFDAKKHIASMRTILRGKVLPSVDESLSRHRADRVQKL